MKIKCKCGVEFDSEGLTLEDFREYNMEPLCDDCEEVERKAQERAQQIRRVKKLYEREIPLEFRQTDKNHPGYSNNLESEVFERFSADSRQGIGIIGKSGVSKSRVMAMLARGLAWRGLNLVWVNASTYRDACDTADDFEREPSERFRARKQLDRARFAKHLFFDDIGSLKATKNVIKHLHRLLESRSNNIMPIFWTSNESLEEMLIDAEKKERARLLSRIEGKSHIINV